MTTTTASLASETTSEKLDFKKILPIFVIVLIDLLGLTIIIPLMPLYATAFGATPLVIGLLGASYPVMQFIGAPLLGRLSDRFGRKPVLMVSQLGTFTGFLILGFANSLWLLFVARILDGISGANISTAQAAISDSTTEKTRTQGLGLIGAASESVLFWDRSSLFSLWRLARIIITFQPLWLQPFRCSRFC